jgi:hypothetical protein
VGAGPFGAEAAFFVSVAWGMTVILDSSSSGFHGSS